MITQPGATAAGDNRYATGLNLGTGVQLSGTSRIDTQGTFATTGNALDVAIDGAGFFRVDLPDRRIGYTRAVHFGRATDGPSVTPARTPLTPPTQAPGPATDLKTDERRVGEESL